MKESICCQNALVWDGTDFIERRDVYICNGEIVAPMQVDQYWDLSQWLILPGIVYTLNLSLHLPKEIGLEMIFKTVQKGATNILINDYQYWKKEVLDSDYPDLASVLYDQVSSSKCINDGLAMINPWISIKQGIQDFVDKGMDLRASLVKVLESNSVDSGSMQVDKNADLIFIQLENIKGMEKLSDVLLPMLLLENEDRFIKAVMKKGSFIFSKYGPSLDLPRTIFEDPFYPQISNWIDAKFDSIEKAIHEIQMGKFVIVVDNQDRENEGDLVIAAQDITPEKAAFMIRYSSGVLCVPMLGERLETLNLPQMVKQNTDSLKTAYAITVDHINTTTGISASDRCMTINALANPTSVSQDFNRPGHVFPLCYHPGGVLSRMGHTEASIDLCKLAGKQPVSVISEITLDNGTMARRNDLIPWARKWNISIITIADLITHQRKNKID